MHATIFGPATLLPFLILQDQNSIAVFTDQENLSVEPVQPVRASRFAPSPESATTSIDAPRDGVPDLDEEVSIQNVKRQQEVLSFPPLISLSIVRVRDDASLALL